MNPDMYSTARSLDVQRLEWSRRRFLAMPLAGAIAWLIAGVAGGMLPPIYAVWTLFIATGCIAYLGMFLSRFTGENFLDKSRPKNTFDSLFMLTVLMALMVYAIAIPFFLLDYTSLPLSVGILTGLMWIPVSWLIRHWIGLVHAVSRTVLVLAAWYAFPEQRFVVIPALIVIIYVFTMWILETRWRKLQRS